MIEREGQIVLNVDPVLDGLVFFAFVGARAQGDEEEEGLALQGFVEVKEGVELLDVGAEKFTNVAAVEAACNGALEGVLEVEVDETGLEAGGLSLLDEVEGAKTLRKEVVVEEV